jgi:hypothetical protein
MNRRSFLRNSALALFGFAVLPPAKTYQRVWRAQRQIDYRLLTFWQQTNRAATCFDEGYLRATEKLLASGGPIAGPIEPIRNGSLLLNSMFFGEKIVEGFNDAPLILTDRKNHDRIKKSWSDGFLKYTLDLEKLPA